MGLDLEPFTLNFDGTEADQRSAAAQAAAAARQVQPPSPSKSSRSSAFRQRLCVHAAFSDASTPSDANATNGSSYNDVGGMRSTSAGSGADDLDDTGDWSDDDVFICGPVADEEPDQEEDTSEEAERDPEKQLQDFSPSTAQLLEEATPADLLPAGREGDEAGEEELPRRPRTRRGRKQLKRKKGEIALPGAALSERGASWSAVAGNHFHRPAQQTL